MILIMMLMVHDINGMHVVTRVNNHELILAQTSGPTQPLILPHNILALENL